MNEIIKKFFFILQLAKLDRLRDIKHLFLERDKSATPKKILSSFRNVVGEIHTNLPWSR